MTVSLALLPSPLLGPATWAPVAQVLRDGGWHTITGVPVAPVRTAHDVLHTFLAQLPTDQQLVLVPHSNAGAYVPALVTQRPVAAAVFVDAVLPPPDGEIPLAPPQFLDFLRTKADEDGRLPGWTEWWEEADTAALFPDAPTRTRVEADQPRVPLSYFQERLPVPADWAGIPGAYLAFGEAYASERDDARARGWPVRTLPGQHLHQLVQPAQVAAELVALLGLLGIRE